MADTGKLVTRGLHASAIKFLLLRGLVPNPSAGLVNACYITRGLGAANRHKPVLHGMATNPGGSSGSSFYIFGQLVVR